MMYTKLQLNCKCACSAIHGDIAITSIVKRSRPFRWAGRSAAPDYVHCEVVLRMESFREALSDNRFVYCALTVLNSNYIQYGRSVCIYIGTSCSGRLGYRSIIGIDLLLYYNVYYIIIIITMYYSIFNYKLRCHTTNT